MRTPINIFCVEPSGRHHYIFDLIFEQLLGVGYCYTNTTEDAHINYSTNTSTGIQCIPYGLLSEDTLRSNIQEEITFETWQDSHCFFQTGAPSLPFDVFSAAFYLVSRYEEWLPYEPDAHNRFPAEESVLTQNNLLNEPLVNQWALSIKRLLIKQYPDLVFNETSFSYISTIDIDQAWKFKYKGVFRNTLGACRDLVLGNWIDVKERLQVLLGTQADPFQTFDWQQAIHSEYDVNCNYFILLGDYAQYDKNASHTTLAFRKLITKLSKTPKASVGIHPSYASNTNNNKVTKEITRLTEILGHRPTDSRQHFLMHKMPETYDCLIANNIRTDYTMGYSTHLGFRAGIASSFFWFDFRVNKASNLALVPFCAMDITPMHYMGQNQEDAIQTLCKLVDKVKAVNGQYVSLWHNDSLSKDGRWRGWRMVYEEVIKYIKA